MQIVLMSIIAALLATVTLIGQGYQNPARWGDRNAIVDSPAPEYANYATISAMTTAANTSMERYRLTGIEQSLVEICRATYWMGQVNNCSAINEGFTWKFMLNQGNTGSLTAVLGGASSSTFSCANPDQYGVYLLNSLYTTTNLSGYTYNLNKSDGSGVIGGQGDPCAYADIVN